MTAAVAATVAAPSRYDCHKMTVTPIPDEDFQLDYLLLMQRFIKRFQHDPQGALAQVRAVLGETGSAAGQRLLQGFLLLTQLKPAEARPLLLQAGLADPGKIRVAYGLIAMVYKYFNTGLPFAELAQYGMASAVGFYRQFPDHPDAQRALLDLLLYFGRADSIGQMLPGLVPGHFDAELAEYRTYCQRLDDYRDRYPLSIVLLTRRRPDALRDTLASLRRALWCDDVEIIAGVNDDWPETRSTLAEAGVDREVVNPAGNTSIHFYRDLFPQAQGKYLIEISDAIMAFPPAFDRDIIQALEQDESLGAVGHWPVRYHHVPDGRVTPALPSVHFPHEKLGKPFGAGPVSGACVGLRRHDFLQFNGFGRATLSSESSETMQLSRKLSVYGKYTGVFFDQGLEVKLFA